MYMNQYWLMASILLPIVGGILTCVLPFKKKTHMMVYLELITILTSVIVIALVTHGSMQRFQVVRFMDNLSISFKVDGLSMVFANLVAILWPFCTLYAFEYMEHEERQKTFFMFYSITYGVTLGISFAADIMTMYLFYELLTLVTVPLILHSMTREAVLAVRTYLYYSLGGAAFALIGIVFLMVYGNGLEFVMGGFLNLEKIKGKENLFLLVYLMAFFGFGVKAAIFPFSAWLPKVGVAPTPVTGLLHAVAVVKAGAFAVARLTYYCFGVDFLYGTWAQYVAMGFAMITIVYGCWSAVKEKQLKRRLAYSTVSNLSYIIFGITLMTPAGLAGALSHLVSHSLMKICAFFCAGAIIHQTGRKYINEINGLGYKMPVVFICFTFSALGLMGVPGLCGFVGKWNLAIAAAESGNVMAYFGIGCLMISAILTSIYMMSIVTRAFFPKKHVNLKPMEGVRDPSWKICVPICFFAVSMVALACNFGHLVNFYHKLSGGHI